MEKYKRLFIAEFITFGISATSLIIIPFFDLFSTKVQDILGCVFAAIFWCGIISGLILVKIISNIKYIMKLNYPSKRFDVKQKFPGIINFDLIPQKIVLYAIILLGFILMVSDMIFHYINKFVMFPVIAITFYAFVVHCVIDGKSYNMYKKANKLIKEGNENG